MEAEIRRAADTVFRVLGTGHTETVYEAALEIELMERGFKHIRRQVPCPIYYKGYSIGVGFIDMELEDEKYLLELKTVAKLNGKDEAQVRKYLYDGQIGLLINFNCSSGELEVIKVEASSTKD